MNIFPTGKFRKQLENLIRKDRKYAERVRKCMYLLEFDIQHPSLRLHKLGTMNFYSVSVDMKIRITLLLDAGEIILLNIGNHDIYKE